MTSITVSQEPWSSRLFERVRTVSLPSLLGFCLVAMGLVAAVSTYVVIISQTGDFLSSDLLNWLVVVNFVLAGTLAVVIFWRLARLGGELRRGQAGAKFHARVVAMFSIVAFATAMTVGAFAIVTFNIGARYWVSDPVQNLFSTADVVSRNYAVDLRRRMAGDAAQAVAGPAGIDKNPELLVLKGKAQVAALSRNLNTLATTMGLQGVYLFDANGQVLLTSKQLGVFARDPKPPSETEMKDARADQISVDLDRELNVAYAVAQVKTLRSPAGDTFLKIFRAVDPALFSYYENSNDAANIYLDLKRNITGVQLLFVALYALVAAIALQTAIWLGLWAAKRFVTPISGLIVAAERVTEGDLKAQVTVDKSDDEIAMLGRAFNRMTSELDTQRAALIDANREMDERRRFTETVLAGVSAGVIGLDADGVVTIVNRAAARFLDTDPEELIGRRYDSAVPELAGLIERAISEPVGRAGGEVNVKRGAKTRSLSVQVASERGITHGYVVTFDDITDLVSAQRTAAWADVARRIAHEIKNPLTPIQLSAERLKRKYSKEIATDPDVFAQCTDTIIRQVGDIGRMVDEFSSFARMPTPVMRREVAQELVQQAVFLQRVRQPQVVFDTQTPKDPVYLEADGRLISQALTNVLKNAGESVAARLVNVPDLPGRIVLIVEVEDETVRFRVRDNGLGLPPEHRDRLTEPYVTTRAKGTGLGLAIVRKILEDHGGTLTLNDVGGGETGAEITMTFPLKQKIAREKTHEQERSASRV